MTDHEPDLLDRQLTAYAARWRESLPEPTSVTAADLGPRLVAQTVARPVRWVAAVAGAAAALALVSAPAWLPRGVSGSPAGGPGSPGSAVVPWAPLPAQHPRIPLVRLPSSPDPAAAAGLPICRAEALKASSQLEAAMGKTYAQVSITTEGSACRLDGYPQVSLRDRAGKKIQVATRHAPPADAEYDGAVRVAPDSPASLTLGWSNWCSDPVGPSRLSIAWQGSAGNVSSTGFHDSPACLGKAGSGPSPIWVGKVQPADFATAHDQSAFAAVTVSPLGDLVAGADRLVSFEVALTASREVSLAVCPDFVMTQFGADRTTHTDRFALNCSAVATKDAQGRPILRQGETTRFAMRVESLPGGTKKFLWQLAVPEPSVFTSGTISIR